MNQRSEGGDIFVLFDGWGTAIRSEHCFDPGIVKLGIVGRGVGVGGAMGGVLCVECGDG